MLYTVAKVIKLKNLVIVIKNVLCHLTDDWLEPPVTVFRVKDDT